MAADISLNGQPLGHATNQFNRYIFSSTSNVHTFSSNVSRIQTFTRLMSSSAGQALTIGSNTLEVSFPLLSQDSRNDEGGGGGRRPIVNTENQYYWAFAMLCALDGTGAP